MGLTREEWRNKRLNRKCKFCTHREFITPLLTYGINAPDHYRCTVKDKIVYENLPRPFCSVYEVDKERDW